MTPAEWADEVSRRDEVIASLRTQLAEARDKAMLPDEYEQEMQILKTQLAEARREREEFSKSNEMWFEEAKKAHAEAATLVRERDELRKLACRGCSEDWPRTDGYHDAPPFDRDPKYRYVERCLADDALARLTSAPGEGEGEGEK